MNREQDRQTERGRRAGFDRKTGEVHGSGSGAGGEGNPDEDYDSDPMAGAGADPSGAPRPADGAEHGPRDRLEGQHS
jgi:hypothetical protein